MVDIIGKVINMNRYFTIWRKTPAEGSILDWDFYVSFTSDEATKVVKNLETRGVREYTTYKVEEELPELSRKFS
jgi:hypothetical protein